MRIFWRATKEPKGAFALLVSSARANCSNILMSICVWINIKCAVLCHTYSSPNLFHFKSVVFTSLCPLSFKCGWMSPFCIYTFKMSWFLTKTSRTRSLHILWALKNEITKLNCWSSVKFYDKGGAKSDQIYKLSLRLLLKLNKLCSKFSVFMSSTRLECNCK